MVRTVVLALVGLVVCGKTTLQQLFDEEDRGLIKYPTAAGKASASKKPIGPSNLVGDEKISGSSKFSSDSSSLFGSKRSGSSIRIGNKMISGSQRFAKDSSPSSHKHCKEGCKHCEEDTFYGDEVSQPHVISKRESITNKDWESFDSSRSLGKSMRFEETK